jgi:hypothetical protein
MKLMTNSGVVSPLPIPNAIAADPYWKYNRQVELRRYCKLDVATIAAAIIIKHHHSTTIM